MPDKVAELSARWSTETGKGSPSVEDQARQSSWTTMRHAKTSLLESLLANVNVITQARLLASSSTESAAWLAALPVSTFGNLLDDASLRISVGLRLGARICTEHKCVCGSMVDQWGHHGLSCKKSRGRQGRHSALNESIQRALGSAKVTSILEPPGLDRGDNKRPDGLTIYPWKFGKPLVWDVMVVDTLASSYIATTSDKAGGAAEAAESRKQRKYELFEDRFIVQPVRFETLGSWTPHQPHLMKQFSAHWPQVRGILLRS